MDATIEDTMPAASASALAPGERIGRFVVLAPIGQGAMGSVLAAYDPDLDRKVAIKVLRDSEQAVATDRSLREARALAALSHPNVIAVYEVGTVADRVFIAMEHAPGGTLRSWLEERRSWREVVDVFVQAGRGLEAAHEAGLVHRDFKPENVLLASNGAVRVADFGIVGVQEKLPAELDRAPLGSDRVSYLTLTRTGTLIGTPAYMAPEQHQCDVVGPPADQFAFCVSLWEALYGERPFAGETYGELAVNVLEETIREPPKDRGVPSWLREVVRRGLAREPASRWPSMSALLEALQRDPVARRRRVATLALTSIATGALAVAVVLRWTRDPTTTVCKGMGDKLAGVWDRNRAEVLQTMLAPDAFERVSRNLDRYASTWVQARTRVCQATHVRGEQSPRLLDLRMACLDQRLGEVDALVGALTQGADPSVARNAVDASFKLSPLSACDDVAILDATMPPPDDARARPIIAGLAKVKALEDTGQYAPALVLAQRTLDDARTLAYKPLVAQLLARRAALEVRTDHVKAAEATYWDALGAGADAHDDILVARLWASLVYVVGDIRARPDDGLMLARAAEAALRRCGSPGEVEARLRNNLGMVWHKKGDRMEARKQLERALALWESAHPDGHPDVALALSNLALIASSEQKLDEAIDFDRRALALRERLLGLDHPDVARSYLNLGVSLRDKADNAGARQALERALEIQMKALGDSHTDVAATRAELGELFTELGDLHGARLQIERSLAIREQSRGPDDPTVASSLMDLGRLERKEHHYDVAEAAYERARKIRTRAYGENHRSVATCWAALGELMQDRGRYADALALHEKALAIREHVFGATDPNLGASLASLAETYAALHRIQDARRAARRALDLLERGNPSSPDLKRARAVLSKLDPN